MPDSPRTDHLSTAAIAAGSVEDAVALLGVDVDVCGHGLPISGPGGEFVQCDECDEGNEEADSFRFGGGEYGGGSM